jgi:NosR/NirI family nitrous oxide reductase transcriptional regulator
MSRPAYSFIYDTYLFPTGLFVMIAALLSRSHLLLMFAKALVAAMLLFWFFAVYSNATLAAPNSLLPRYLPKADFTVLAPGIDSAGAIQADPPLAPLLKDGAQVGVVFLNTDYVNATGYSGKPIQVLVAMDLDGTLLGAQLVDHKEPIVLIGIPEKKIVAMMGAYTGLDVVAMAEGGGNAHDVDIVSGATVTVMIIDDSVLRSAIKVARKLGLGGLTDNSATAQGPQRSIDLSLSKVESWQTLNGDGAVRRLNLTLADVNAAFARSSDPLAVQNPELGAPDETFIDLYVGLASVPGIGRSLLGENEYRNLTKKLQDGQQAVLLAAKGRYSFKGSGYVRGGIFDRFQIIQGDNAYRFRDKNQKRLAAVKAEGAPDFAETDLFYLPADGQFDPTQPWRVELLVGRRTGATSKAFETFDLGYQLPDRFMKIDATASPATESAGNADRASDPARRNATEPDIPSISEFLSSFGKPGTPLWQRMWQGKTVEIIILLVAIVFLTLIFFFQSWLVKRPRLLDGLRLAFLTFTLFGIGFYANAQLSIVNVMAFFNALLTDFSWDYFLMDPLIFLLWFSVAASLLFWGRGVFCGWLCPFGAMQELMNRLAKLVRIPQIKVPWWLHERIWALKYVIFLVLFGASLYSLAWAEQLAEVEPFKTAIILKFARNWPFVLYAALLLGAGLFIERFYCRYLCPLGAALAIPARLRMFDWLKRYKECGSPCQRCAKECMVQAIHPEGHINPNECLQCLHCQMLYQHDHKCPVLIQKRIKWEKRLALSSSPDVVRKKLHPAAGR